MSAVTTDQRFGDCLECSRNDGYLNLQMDHVFICDQHKTAWCAGANLFSSWQVETEEDWQRNEEKLRGDRWVQPIYPPKSPPEPDTFLTDFLPWPGGHHLWHLLRLDHRPRFARTLSKRQISAETRNKTQDTSQSKVRRRHSAA